MADEVFPPTSNFGQGHLIGGLSSVDNESQIVARFDPVTNRLLVDVGTVTFDTTGLATSALQADIITAIEAIPGGGGEQYVDGVAVNAAYKGTIAAGTDGSNYQFLLVDSSGRLLLGATTNAIGKLAANSGVDIGDVDILSIAAGDNNIGNVDIVSLPAGNLGMQLMAASLSIVPASNITDATYIGDIKFGESLPAGTAAIGKLAANSGVDIGDVDILSIAAGDNNIGNVDIVTLPAITIAAAQTIATVTTVGAVTSITNALPSGTNAIGKLSANSGVDIGDVDILSIVPGVAATSLGKAEDAAHQTGDTGVAVWGVRDDTLGAFSGAEGDYEPFHMTAAGRLYVSATVDAALPAGTNGIGKLTANSGVDIGDVDVLSMPGTGVEDAAETAGGVLHMMGAVRRDTAASSSGTSGDNSTINVDALGKLWTTGSYAEDAAHSSGDVGSFILAVRDDDPVAATSGTAGDYEALHTDGFGVLWTRSVPDTTDLANLGGAHVKKYYTNAGAVTDGIIWSPAAGKRWYVTDIYIQVSAAATVTLEDDLAAGDSPIWKAELAANSGWSHSFVTPWFSGEDAADLIITTTAGNVYVTVVGYEI